MPRPVFTAEKCKACAMCVQACPKQILAVGDAFNSKGYRTVYCRDEAVCTGCAFCARMCPDAVIEINK